MQTDAADNQATDASEVVKRGNEILTEQQAALYRRTDRMFSNLMAFQWIAGIAAAIWISPRTWIGTESRVHVHVWAAIFVGGIITSFPVALAWKRPGCLLTRHVIAIGQTLTSALLIHLTGGRIETHFHVFGSLAFLAFYRDWKVLVSATVIVATDHLTRGLFWPQSVFGVLAANPWRWVEHAGWVVFENLFLMISIRQSLLEMRQIAERQAKSEFINQRIEQLVQQRTNELEQTHKQLVEASRRAGMADVATSVLHNVGNVLNSVNTSITLISEHFHKSKDASITKVAGLLQEHANDLGTFMTHDPKGQKLPGFLEQLAQRIAKEKVAMITETESLRKNVDHIKDIVATQQSYGKVSGAIETVKVIELAEDALRMNATALVRHEVQVIREFDDHLPSIDVDRHKALQILVNLIRNAKQACEESGLQDRKLIVRIANGGDKVRFALTDNGVGIAAENLRQIFIHGFTTKKEGHGFGLHTSALAAKEMGGALTVQSGGLGKGATFTLELPWKSQANEKKVQSVRRRAALSEVSV